MQLSNTPTVVMLRYAHQPWDLQYYFENVCHRVKTYLRQIPGRRTNYFSGTFEEHRHCCCSSTTKATTFPKFEANGIATSTNSECEHSKRGSVPYLSAFTFNTEYVVASLLKFRISVVDNWLCKSLWYSLDSFVLF